MQLVSHTNVKIIINDVIDDFQRMFKTIFLNSPFCGKNNKLTNFRTKALYTLYTLHLRTKAQNKLDFGIGR